MKRNQRQAEDLSIEELEAILARKKIEARQERLRKFQRSGRAIPIQTESADVSPIKDHETELNYSLPEISSHDANWSNRVRSLLSGLLFVIEMAAAVGLAYVFLAGFGVLKQLNQEAAEAMIMPTASPTPLIMAVVLPSGHTPPTSPGGAAPNENEIPDNLRPLLQSMPRIEIPTPGPEQAKSIYIPAIWQSPAPVVQGDEWEHLKKGVGQHLGSANPGEPGNLVLSAHNDIFGELFRDLDRLKPGDRIIVRTATQEYIYRVTGLQIVEPMDVSIMAMTQKPTVTLISCYPYMVDDERIVVFGELEDE